MWVDECPDCGRSFAHDREDGARSMVELHRCAGVVVRDTSTYEHVGVGLAEAMALADAARREWLESSAGREGMEQQAARDLAAERQERMRAFLVRGVPKLTAEALALGVDHHGQAISSGTKLAIQIGAAAAKHMILVFGPVGTGKTMEACRWLMRAGPSARYVLAGDVAAMTSRWSTDREKIDDLRSAAALVVDEVKRNSETDAKEQDRIADLLQNRYDNRAPTMVLANMMPEDFDFGERLARRTTPPNGVHLVASEILCPVQRMRSSRPRNQQGANHG